MAAAAAASPAPKLKLQYFGGRGRAEISRIMLAEKKIAYEDFRVDGKDWPAMKSKAPFGQMPILHIGNTQIAQSKSIERYIARAYGLNGANELEAARVDMIAEGIRDAVTNYFTAAFLKDENEKKTKFEAYFKDEFPRWAGQLTAILKENNGGKGYFVGNDVTYADINFYVAFDTIQQTNAAAFTAFPELSALIARVAARPNIAHWIKTRPVTPF